DIVLVKLSGDTGAHVWSRRFGDPADQDLRGIATFPTNEFVITGEFSGKIDFGAGLLDNVPSDDAFVPVLPP
ncbi:MAG TPA: hypothetical protein PL196_11245, partial [Burkholderiaceae bacterium]|nr:hypothetical protein [Burkholderiaceae bacterium]